MGINIKDFIKDKVEDFGIWFTVTIKYPYWDIQTGIKNLWKFKGIVWKDRWYDHYYIVKMMIFKLENMIDNWDDAHYVGSEFTKKRMIVFCKRLKVFDDDLEELEYDYIVNKKYTKEEFKKAQEEIIAKTWYSLGKNIRRFWD